METSRTGLRAIQEAKMGDVFSAALEPKKLDLPGPSRSNSYSPTIKPIETGSRTSSSSSPEYVSSSNGSTINSMNPGKSAAKGSTSASTSIVKDVTAPFNPRIGQQAIPTKPRRRLQ